MNVEAPTDPVRRSAERTPVRAVAQHVAGRVIVAVLATTTIVLVILALSDAPVTGTDRSADRPREEVGGERVVTHTVASLLRAVDVAVTGASGDLVALATGRPEGRRLPLELEVGVGDGSAALGAVLTALTESGVDAVGLHRITPTPEGFLASVTGHAQLSVERLPPSDADQGPLAVGLSRDIERSGVALRALDVDAGPGVVVRLEVEGDAERLTALVALIEERYSAPARIARLHLRVLDDGRRRVGVTFRPRDMLTP